MIPLPTTEHVLWAVSGLLTGALIAGLATWIVLRRRHRRSLIAKSDALDSARDTILELTRARGEDSVRLERLSELKNTLQNREEHLRELTRRSAKLETIIRQDRLESRERIAWLEDAHGRLRDAYQALSAAALKDNNAAFMDLAKSVLNPVVENAKTDLDARGKIVGQMIHPLKESLDRYDKQIQEMERVREAAYGSISQQMKSLVRTQELLQKETGRLATALRTPQVRGRWGELTLKRVAELSGMQSHCDFIEQPSVDGADGRLRPDLVVHLPGSRQVVVDAKVPLSAYLDALEAETEAQRENCLRQHAAHVFSHVQQLSRKAYWSQFQPTPEFVVLFIPGEHFFSAALGQTPLLIEEAAKRNVILATPTTLISLLKAVAFGWRQEKTTENARLICDLGQELYARLWVVIGHFHALGKEIGQTVSAYNRTVGSFERRVLTTARKLEAFGLKGNDNQNPPTVETLSARPVTPRGEDTDDTVS
jgi:DNA recombination protein RmuC